MFTLPRQPDRGRLVAVLVAGASPTTGAGSPKRRGSLLVEGSRQEIPDHTATEDRAKADEDEDRNNCRTARDLETGGADGQ